MQFLNEDQCVANVADGKVRCTVGDLKPTADRLPDQLHNRAQLKDCLTNSTMIR